jgi:WD40 repeat protein
MIYDVAISYAKEETVRLEKTKDALEREGLSVWTDRGLLRLGEGEQAERLVPAGVEHWEAISSAIDHAATFIFLDSPHWRASKYCRNERAHAHKRGIRTIAVGDPPKDDVKAASRVAAGDTGALVAAVRAGLDISRAHARVRAATFADVATTGEPSGEDVTTLAEADLGELGMSLLPQMRVRMEEALARQRRRRRRIGAILGAALMVAAALAVVAVFGWIAAQRDEARAASTARHIESLAVASASELSTNTFARLALARRGIDLEQNSTTVAALRTAIEGFGEGITLHLDQDEPLALAIADNGNVAIAQNSGALTLVTARGGQVQREVSADVAAAGLDLAFAPSGSKLAVIRGDGEAEVIDFATARVVRVRGAGKLAAVLLVSDKRGIAVGEEGQVYEFDPGLRHPRAKQLQSLRAPVRAAAIADVEQDGKFALATLVDGAVEVTKIGGHAAPWRVPLAVPQGPFSLGWESLRVCGGKLVVLASGTTSDAAVSFNIPYTVSPSGKVAEIGSLIHSNGSICLPEGSALAVDFVQGQYPVPEDGPELPNLVGPPGGRVQYAIASSDNDQWAAAAGGDGTLKIVALANYGRTKDLEQVETVAPTVAGPPLVAGDGEIQTVSLGSGSRRVAAYKGRVARGAYADPHLGTVIAVGDELLVLDRAGMRKRIQLGRSPYVVHPGRPGASALVVFAESNAVTDVPLDGGRRTTVPLPADVGEGSSELSDVVELPGSLPRLVTAATDGYLDVLAYPSGHELRRRRIAPPGPVALSVGKDGELVSSGSDGVVRLLDPRTLAVETSRRVLPPGPTLVTTNPAESLAAVFGRSDEAVVVGLPGLDPITRTPPIDGLNSLAFEGDKNLLLGADVRLLGAGDEASITSWPVCATCAANPSQLRRMAAALGEPNPSDARLRFRPVR